MLEFKSQLQNFRLPLFVAKRNKGSNEVLSTVTVSSTGAENPEDFIRSLLSISRSTISLPRLQNLVSEICDDFKIQDLSINVSFLYHLDRTSPEYAVSTFELPCIYHIDVNDRIVKTFMGVRVPVRIADAVPLAGRLEFFVEEPKNLFFEDLLDYVQKYTGTRLYPKVSSQETASLKLLMDEGKTPKEYLSILSEISGTKDLGDGGYIKILTPDVYSGYEIEHSVFWVNKKIKYLVGVRKDALSWEDAFITRLANSIIGELSLSDRLYLDAVFIIRETIKEWKDITDTVNETIKDHGKLAHKLIRESTKRKIINELQSQAKAA